MDNAAIATLLIEAGNIDTVYRDVYLDRARTFLAPSLSLEEFNRLEQERGALAELPVTIARALARSHWPLVKELSERASALKHATDGKRALAETARSVYDARDVRLDPFSPGLLSFTRIPTRDLATLRTRLLGQLEALERADVPWHDFYAARRDAFQTQPQGASTLEGDAATSSPAEAVEAARQALRAGDMRRLALLADALLAMGTPGGTASSPAAAVEAARTEEEPRQQLRPVAFSCGTVARARHLGFAPRHLEPRAELASLRRHAWTPLSDERGNSITSEVSLPAGSPQGLRDGVDIFMLHPLVNSGGARYLPNLLAEDVLVEDFPDPADGNTAPASELVKVLGLPGRLGLPRIVIEQALLMHVPAFSKRNSASIRASSVWSAFRRMSTFGWARRKAGGDSHSGRTSMGI